MGKTKIQSKASQEQYITTRTLEPRYKETSLSIPEWRIVQRMRELSTGGVDIMIIEFRNGRPKARSVGKPEG